MIAESSMMSDLLRSIGESIVHEQAYRTLRERIFRIRNRSCSTKLANGIGGRSSRTRFNSAAAMQMRVSKPSSSMPALR